jgi:hypothetical protein
VLLNSIVRPHPLVVPRFMRGIQNSYAPPNEHKLYQNTRKQK